MENILQIWSVGESGVEPLDSLKQMAESEFEELLVGDPEMLEPGLKLVGRQTPTEVGSLDLLAVDGGGRLVVYELKGGTPTRNAVAQVLDYASALDAMSLKDLAKHIAERSGSDGIEQIDDFGKWYTVNFGRNDLSSLMPPRMVLVGLGVDPVAERMARFISEESLDLSVVTFHAFLRNGERLLARQLEVELKGGSVHEPRSTTAETRRERQAYFADNGYEDLFEQVRDDLRNRLPGSGVLAPPTRMGVNFRLTEPKSLGDTKLRYRSYFEVRAGYFGPDVYSVRICPTAISRGGEDAIERLSESVDLEDWPRGKGGRALSFKSAEEWERLWPELRKFVKAVLENRTEPGAPAT